MGRKAKNPGLLPTDIADHEQKNALRKQIKKDPGRRSLTPREEALAIEMLAHPEKSPKEQVVAAGYSDKTNALMVRRQIKGKLRKTFDEIGLYESDIALLILDGINAMRVRIDILKRTKKGGTVEEYVATTSIPDLGMRHKYLETLIRLGGYNPASKIDINSNRHETLDVNVNVSNALENIPQDALEASVLADMDRRLLRAKKADCEVLEDDEKACRRTAMREAV